MQPLTGLVAGFDVGSLDLRGIDGEVGAEVAAMTRACGPALDRIAVRVGRPPLLRWGVVCWRPD